ncbi:hypothetical protein IBE33_07365 [Francisella philomiragia]|nr:hypothetical protein [Francisella philomiragia]MBK2341334.1 hypothetical protein [Francisella philomiragia]
MKDNNIMAPFHYAPLHNSEYGKHNTRFTGKDTFTTTESERLLRLPLFYDHEPEKVKYIIEKIEIYFL